jgi:type II secretory ATPase GspE/PulE/Tfp pilus assembly ATPase PilB-like protein
MQSLLKNRFPQDFTAFDPTNPQYATQVVDAMLAAGQSIGASDLHLQPTAEGLELKYRVDGVLLSAACFPIKLAPNILARLKVQAQLLTYLTDRPQEGRIRDAHSDVEMRVATFPTLYGERAVVRLFGHAQQYEHLDDLAMPTEVLAALRHALCETSGAILISGPAGSGKTTTAYACLRELAEQSHGAKSLVSIEDPIEVAVHGAAQSQVNPAAGVDLSTGLQYLMRQDPEVILVGEIRDRNTAEAALQASLTGHLLLTTFHAGSAAETIGRLLDMAIEPYVLRSGVLTILNQRLLRRLCTCAQSSEDPADRLGLPVGRVMLPVGCERCNGTGYHGRFLLVEMLSWKTGVAMGDDSTASHRSELAKALLARADTSVLERLAVQAGMVTRWPRAYQAVDAGQTSPAEVRRVLGFSNPACAVTSG